jgi:periplasmic divalent cation tolerance protein
MKRKSKDAMTNKIVVLVTCRSNQEAQEIGRALVDRKLAACANILGAPVKSIYRWKGKAETGNEVLLVLKSSRARFAALDRAIRMLHSYDIPEIIALPIVKGSRSYLAWISESVGAGKRRARRRSHVR